MESKYCIYRHLKPNGEVFYIGIGNLKRPYNKKDRSIYWKNTVAKYGYEIQILKSDLTWDDAKELEIILISWYKRKDCCGGTLVNLTDGGEGSAGRMWTEEEKKKISIANTGKTRTDEVKQKMSDAKKGEKHPNYGKPMTEELSKILIASRLGRKASKETKQKMSASHKGKHEGALNPMWGKVWTDEAKQSKSISIIEYYKNNPHPGCREVINTQTLEIYSSIKELSEKLAINYHTIANKLSGHDRNNTDLIYLSEYLLNMTVDSTDGKLANVKVELDASN